MGSFRLGRDVRHPVYERGVAGLSFRLAKYVTLSSLYGYFATQMLAGQDSREHRLSFDATVSAPVSRCIVSDKSVFDRRFRDPKDSTRYHNKLQLEREIRVARVSLRVFISDEALYDWSLKGWVRNRLAIGGGKSLSRKLSVEVYYLRQNATRMVPRDVHAAGITVKTRF